MNAKANVREGEGDARQVVFGSEHSGQVMDEEWVTGYGHAAGGELYADLVRDFRFPGSGWGVIVQSGGVQSPRTCTTPSWMRTGNVATGS